MQPRNRTDALWTKLFVDLGQTARDRLRDFFQEVAALGRAARGIKPSEDFDPQPVLDQHARIQAAYDRYLQAKTAVYEEWTRYLQIEWFVGREVLKVFHKIDNALPSRVEDIDSPFAEKLNTARRASTEATERKRKKTDAGYTALVWTDRVITAIEIATLVGSAKAAMKQTFKQAIAKGLNHEAARRVTIAYGVAHLATAAASAVAMAEVVPSILAAAGLDEAEVRAGLAIFRTVFTLVGLRSLAKRQPGRFSEAESKKSKRFLKAFPMHQGRRAEVGRTYPHKQVYIRRPDGKGYWKLDYYDPVKGEIISFKDVQLARVRPETAVRYLKELERKYRPGSDIANVPSTDGTLVGQQLKGKMILEVPIQTKPVPQAVLDAARERKIEIRDTSGRLY